MQNYLSIVYANLSRKIWGDHQRIDIQQFQQLEMFLKYFY